MIKHLVAGGCSFTADGIGGIPPTSANPEGGCSFTIGTDYAVSEPKTWVGFVAQQLRVKSMINVAAGSHGNMATANNLLHVLTKFNYDPKETMVLFNISDPSRLDLPCDWTHPQRSSYCHWPSSVIDFLYFSSNSDFIKSAQKNIGISQINDLTTNALNGLISFLKLRGFSFRFLTMRNYTQLEPLNHLIEAHKEYWISLGPRLGMMEYAMDLGLTVSTSDIHPNLEGQKIIAEQVVEKLSIE